MSGTTWVEQSPTTSPSERTGGALCPDGASGATAILFGGLLDSNLTLLNDTWQWTGSNWTQLSPAHAPAARNYASTAYDSGRSVIVLFGGGTNGGPKFGDTWTWDGTDWTQQNPAHSPAATQGAAMAYDSVHGVSVLFIPSNSQTWTWDGTDWTQQNPAHVPSLAGAGMAFVGYKGNAVLLGTGGGATQTWTWDGTDWTQQNPASEPTYSGVPLAYDAPTGLVVHVDQNATTGTTWTWDGSNWTNQSAAPPADNSDRAVTAPTSAGVLLLNEALGGTWLLDLVAPRIACTLTAPPNAAYADIAATGGPFQATYHSGGYPTYTVTGYQFHQKQSGGASYSFWNAATSAMQSTAVTNVYSGGGDGSTVSISLPTGSSSPFPDGVVYNWSMALQDQGGLTPFPPDFTFSAQQEPSVVVTGPSGTVSNSQPTTTWTVTVASGASATAYRNVIYPTSVVDTQGFTPGQTTGATFDTGVVNGSATSVTPPALPQSSYTSYVQVTETGGETSSWSSTSFTVSFDAPAVPTLTATPDTDPTTGAPMVALGIQGHDNLLSAEDASFEGGTVGTYNPGAQTTVANSTAEAKDGTHSLAMTCTGPGQNAVYPAPVAVEPGDYTAMVWVRPGSTVRNMVVPIEIWAPDASNPSALGTYQGVLVSKVVSEVAGEWVQILLPFTIANGTAWARADIEVDQGVGAANEVHYIDEVGIFPGVVTEWTRGGLAGTTTAEVQFSDDGGTTWDDVRGASAVALSDAATQTASVNDYESPLGKARLYRARVVNGSLASAWSAEATATLTADKPWLTDPLDPTTALGLEIESYTGTKRPATQADYVILGRSDDIIASDVRRKRQGSIGVVTLDGDDRTALLDLLERNTTLLLRWGPGEPGSTSQTLYFAVMGDIGDSRPGRIDGAQVAWTIPFVEQSRPA